MALVILTKEEFEGCVPRLWQLVDADPAQAIREARQLRGKGPVKQLVQTLRGSILIDAGGTSHDPTAVLEGVTLFRRLASAAPKQPTFRYNLANGLSQLATLQPYSSSDWYVTTHDTRREARRTFQNVAEETGSLELRAQALINLGNELDSGFRWVEAYDRWVRALATDPSNAVAALSTANMLLRRMQRHRHSRVLHRITGYYARLAEEGSQNIAAIAGRKAAEIARRLPTFRSSWRPRTLREIKDEYERFVATHRLGLVGTIEGLDLRKRRWDDAYIEGISEKRFPTFRVPPVFAMINQLKADFCAARWIAFTSRVGTRRDASWYADTLDYAVYGVGPSLLILAQRAALDILDRVAVCANEYFGLGSKPTEIYFQGFWREKGGTGDWRAPLQDELTAQNPGLIALGELAADLGEGGMLAAKHSLRNIGTHRFSVLHDLGNSARSPSPGVDHHNIEEFFTETVDTLQVVRSAILYLFDAIECREARQRTGGPRATLFVPPHHYIRGKE